MGNNAEQERFLDLIKANQGMIYKICNAYCKSKADREDLAQEIIFHLWKGSPQYKPDLKFSTWMYRVALNVAISWYRRTKKTGNTLPVSENHLGIESPEPEIPDRRSDAALLQEQVAALPELDRALILLYFEEKSYREIAEIIGITETNVATKVSRIKEKLKQAVLNAKNHSYGRY